MILINFDVLAVPGDELGSRLPRPETRKLWNSLLVGYNGRVAIMATGITNTPLLLEWLKREGYKASTIDVISTDHPDDKVDRVATMNAAYGKIYWYVDIDPITVAKVAHMGIPTLLLTVPDIVRPEWVDDRVPKDWASLVEEIESQALAKAERNWYDDPRDEL